MTGDTMGGGATRSDGEDRDSAVVRSLLATVDDVPAGRLTSSGLLARGRRVRRQRRSTATVAGVLLLGLATVGGIGLVDAGSSDQVAQSSSLPLPPGSTAARPAGCTVEALALPARATSGQVNDGSPSGRYLVGFTAVGGSLATPVRWDGTKLESIKIKGVGEAHGVNDSGMVVGEGQRTSGGPSYAWAYVGGKVVELPVPPGYVGAEANAVNARGDVAGMMYTSDGTAAVVWRGVGASPRADVLSVSRGAVASGISDAGVVVGELGGVNGAPYQWDANGQGSQLPRAAGTVGGGAHGVRGGWAYGLVFRDPKNVPATPNANEAQRPTVVDPNESVLWNLATSQATVLKDRVGAVNTRGAAVVNHTVDRTAALRDPAGTVRELPGLTNGAHVYAYALNDAGTLAAGTSGSAAVRWQCVN
ncbi:hypothetical protein ACH4OY_26590 [Micromonospora rubida]|uniref:HAF repeat-containing protein n=1 Tax=Micromonospora rubida TaxID=2697657 RepID=A0ABW7SW32_9ACTN